MKKKLLTIPTFRSVEEEAEFWDSHDSADYEWEEVTDVKFAKRIKSVYKCAKRSSIFLVGSNPTRLTPNQQGGMEFPG